MPDLLEDLTKGALVLCAGAWVVTLLLPVAFWFALLIFLALQLTGWSIR